MADIFTTQSSRLTNHDTQVVHLSKVEVTGAQDYSDDYISSLLQPLLQKNVYTVDSLSDTISKTEKTISLSNAGFQNIKVLVDRDETAPVSVKNPTDIYTKLNIDLTATKLDSRLKFTTHTNNEGMNFLLGFADNNYFGNGESLSVIGSINDQINNGYAHFNFFSPLKNFIGYNLLVSATGANYSIGGKKQRDEPSFAEQYNQVVVGINKSGFISKTRNWLFSGFNGIAVTQNNISGNWLKEDQVGTSAKASIVSGLTLQNLKAISKIFFPVNGFKFQYLQEYSKLNAASDRKFFKSIFATDSYLTLDKKNAVTFNHSASFGNLHTLDQGKEHISDKFSYASIFASNRSVNSAAFANPSLASTSTSSSPSALSDGTYIDGNTFINNTFRIFTKIPIFHQYIPDNNSILRLQFYLNSTKIFSNLGNFQSHVVDLVQNGSFYNVLQDTYANNAGVGLFYRSQVASVDFGYAFALNDKTANANYKPGLQFGASLSFP